MAHKYLGFALLGGVTNCALGAAVAAGKYESGLSIGAAVVLGVGTAPVVCFGLYRCARERGVPVEASVSALVFFVVRLYFSQRPKQRSSWKRACLVEDGVSGPSKPEGAAGCAAWLLLAAGAPCSS